MISIIATIGKNNELGKDNHLIWNLKSDLKFFKKLTINHILVMGRKTFENLETVYPNRYYIVLSKKLTNDNCVEVVDNVASIISRFSQTTEDVYVVGGLSMYQQFISCAQKVFLTEIDSSGDADMFFPDFNREEYNKTIIDEGIEDGIKFCHVLYERK